MADADYVSASEAARLLDVKLQTLYAYASRGWLRSAPSDKGRSRRYLKSDLLRLRTRHEARAGHTAVAAGALRWGEPVLDSAISEVTPRGPRYRGYLATRLGAEGRSYEAVAELLWTSELPENEPTWPGTMPDLDLRTLAAVIPSRTPPLPTLALVVPALGMADVSRYALQPTAELDRARRVLRQLAAAVALPRGITAFRRSLAASTMAESLTIALGGNPKPAVVKAVNVALLLCADHELNVSSFAARVAASTDADLYACLAAGMGALAGPRHGTSPDRVEALMREVGTPGRALVVVQERARRGELPSGFGHTLYPGGDPRTPPLLDAARTLAPRNVQVRTIDAVVKAMETIGSEPPSVDLGLVAISAAAGLPAGSASTLFGVGRLAGWVAHIREQRAEGALLRPRARYVGPPHRP